MIFETHAHYDDDAFDEDREELLASMIENGVGRIVNACASIDGLSDTIVLMDRYPFIYGAIGVHPDDADKITRETLDEIRRLSRHEKAVAIGEIGLDYYWHKEKEEHRIQQDMFRAQMDIAREEKLPFMVHSRDAAEDTLKIVREYVTEGMYGGIIHCFSYGKEIAREYLNMGLHLGIGGVVTFKNARKLKEVVEYAPLSQLVLETDCPYLAPEPNRGKRNSSLNLPYVAQAIAEIKGISAEEVIAVTEDNAKKLLLQNRLPFNPDIV
ncbi:MAG: TatD family hydrolase [Eubacteriales bacterium]|nr:TatD family hydrolase [Eubacteriales bacterium]